MASNALVDSSAQAMTRGCQECYADRILAEMQKHPAADTFADGVILAVTGLQFGPN
jgi:hypothetical protein